MTLQRKKNKKSKHTPLYIWSREQSGERRIEDTGDNRYNQVRIDKCVLKGQNKVTFIIPSGGKDSERPQYLQLGVEGMPYYLNIIKNCQERSRFYETFCRRVVRLQGDWAEWTYCGLSEQLEGQTSEPPEHAFTSAPCTRN